MEDGSTTNPFSKFQGASPETPSFFQQLKQKKSDQGLRQRLEDVLGPLPDDVFERIKQSAHANFELAVMKFLDEQTSIEPPPALPDRSSESSDLYVTPSPRSNGDSNSVYNDATEHHTDKEDELSAIESKTEQEDDQLKLLWENDRRLIGSLQAELWCTRSGRGLVKFNEKLRVDRAGTASNNNNANSKSKDDIMVKFYNSEGLYFARALESDARFMSALMDANVCHFEATVIYAEPMLRLGSTLFVQVDCYLKREAFSTMSSHSSSLKPKKKQILDESKETHEEKLVRLRQVALQNMFSRLNLIEAPADMKQTLIEANKLANSHNHRHKSASPVADVDVAAAKSQLSTSDASPHGAEDEEDSEELDEDQLEMFYKDAVSAPTNSNAREADPADSFAINLYPYQKRGLAWMLDREKEISEFPEKNGELHPLWTELNWPEGDPFWSNLNSGELSLQKPTLASRSRGGILADEMGLGKTISTLALIHTATHESRYHSTLVVAPMSLLSQWDSEIRSAARSPNTCGCLVYYGNASSQGLRNTLSDFLSNSTFQRRIVVTTYGIVASEHKQRHLFKTGGLFNTTFDRIVLDEAHTIKNRSTQAAKACFDLQGQRRWALTGTPVVNRLEDLYSLVRFLGLEPWNNFTFWRAFITEQFQKPETRERAMKTVQAVVAPICLRRTKAMRDPETNRPLVELPKKRVEIKRIPFTEEERTLYSHLYARVRESVQAKVMEGTASSKYSTILALLLRLRQVCCHPMLLRKLSYSTTNNSKNGAASVPATKRQKTEVADPNLEPAEAVDEEEPDDLKLDLTAGVEELLERFSTTPSIEYTADTLKRLLDHPLENEECPICSENQKDPILTGCLHSACHDCLLSHIEYLRKRGDDPICHICRASIDVTRLFVVNKQEKKLQAVNQGMQSSKVRALVNSLRQAQSQGYGKAVVFSQFTSFLDLIEVNLKEAGFTVFRFDGSMSQAQRASAVEGFTSSKCRNSVLLLSQKAGGVGLNLVVANHAYLMDPWWNFANESQAIDRIHRMGQTDDVSVTRFIIQGSIEERMLKIQERKHALSNVLSEEQRRAENLENIRLLLELEDDQIN